MLGSNAVHAVPPTDPRVQAFIRAVAGGMPAREAAVLCRLSPSETAATVGALRKIGRGIKRGGRAVGRGAKKAGRAVGAAAAAVRRKIFNAFFGKLTMRRARKLAWDRRRALQPTRPELAEARLWARQHVRRSGILGKVAVSMLAGSSEETERRNVLWQRTPDGGVIVDFQAHHGASGSVRHRVNLTPADVRAIAAMMARLHRRMHGRAGQSATVGAGPAAAIAVPVLIALLNTALKRAERSGAPADPRKDPTAPAPAPADEAPDEEPEATAESDAEMAGEFFDEVRIMYRPPDSDISPGPSTPAAMLGGCR